MIRFDYVDLNGKKKTLTRLGDVSALPFIQKRLEYWMPVETIASDKIRETVASIAIDCQRDITPAEANQMVNAIKEYLLREIDGAEKFYVSKNRERKNK